MNELIRRAEGLAGCGTGRVDATGVDAGWNGVTLARGAVHEWFAGAQDSQESFPPLCIFVHLARTAVRQHPGKHVVWIGRQCFAHARTLLPAREGEPAAAQEAALVQRSIFVDPPDDAARLWSIDLALRCPGVGVVIADGSRLDMAASRRLQLAAQGGAGRDEQAGGALVLIARPARELHDLSAAATRWRVEPVVSPGAGAEPQWTVQLLRCKGLQPAIQETLRRFVVEWRHAQGLVHLPSNLRGGSGETARADPPAQPIRLTA